MTGEDIRQRIIHVLRIYPTVSPTMLQAALGPQIPATLWRPVLMQMVDDKEVDFGHLVAESPSGQHRSYARITLEDSLKN